MEPSGALAQKLLELLQITGIPAILVTVVGTAIALWQYASGLGGNSRALQAHTLRAFASSSRRVRAWALFVASHILAVTTTLGVAERVLGDPIVLDTLGIVSRTAILQVGVGIVVYFLAIDWWAFRYGDTLPIYAGWSVGLVGGLAVVFYGVSSALLAEHWGPALAWFLIAAIWFYAVTWASSTGSGLARAIQNS